MVPALHPPTLLCADIMEFPPPGLLAASTVPPTRQAVFNPYEIPLSPTSGLIRPQPQRQPELLWLHWMVSLSAWIVESLSLPSPHPLRSTARSVLREHPPGTSTSKCAAQSTSSASCSVDCTGRLPLTVCRPYTWRSHFSCLFPGQPHGT